MKRVLAGLTLALAPAAQSLKDPRVLAPEEHRLHARIDMARLRETGLWRVLSHSVLVKDWLAGTFTPQTGIDVEDLKQVVAFQQQILAVDGREASTSVLFEGTANVRATAARDAVARQRSGDPSAAFEPPQTIGGRTVWFGSSDAVPTVVELGPGMVWVAQPAALVRERLEALTRGNPEFKPTPELEPLRSRDGGELFVAIADAHALSLLDDLLPLPVEFSAVCLRADVRTDLVLAVTGLLRDASHGERVLDGLRQMCAGAVKDLQERRLPLLAWLVERIEIARNGGEISVRFRLDQRQIAGLPALLMGLLLHATYQRRHEEAQREQMLAERRRALQREYSKIFGEEEAASRPASQPATRPGR